MLLYPKCLEKVDWITLKLKLPQDTVLAPDNLSFLPSPSLTSTMLALPTRWFLCLLSWWLSVSRELTQLPLWAPGKHQLDTMYLGWLTWGYVVPASSNRSHIYLPGVHLSGLPVPAACRIRPQRGHQNLCCPKDKTHSFNVTYATCRTYS